MTSHSNPTHHTDTMASSITTTGSAKTRREPRDTGFPEPFNSIRNTTLPHPDADLSPNACLSQEDIDPDRALMRTRRSFLRKKRRTLNHGRITPASEALYSAYSLVQSDGGDHDSLRIATNPSLVSVRPTTPSIRISRDETDSLASRTTRREDEDTPPTSPDVPSHRSKKGFLSKWRRN
jgi:hypothetical protein